MNMRIITGRHKGKSIRVPEGIRPTQNKVRKAIFDILGDISGLSFLELFAGTGAVGFEAYSRGAAELVLVESGRGPIEVIRKNIEDLGVRNCRLYPVKVQEAIPLLHKEGRLFDIIFLDPPYHNDISKKALQTLGAYDILAPDGLIVVQHFKKDDLPAGLGVLSLFKKACYGDTILSFYSKSEATSSIKE